MELAPYSRSAIVEVFIQSVDEVAFHVYVRTMGINGSWHFKSNPDLFGKFHCSSDLSQSLLLPTLMYASFLRATCFVRPTPPLQSPLPSPPLLSAGRLENHFPY